MFDRPESGERTVMVYVHPPGGYGDVQAEEFEQLALSAGAEIVCSLSVALRRPDSRFFLGSGKIDEIAEVVADEGGELVLISSPLSPAQERNLEKRLKCRVLDRIGLILDLFAQRASTFEGKLQVELAQLRHLSTRLVRGWTHLERQKGGIGLRGPGEKQLETDRRLIAERIKRIDNRLVAVEQRRALGRRARQRAEAPVVSLVGYTNAGKSSLFNALTGAGVLTEDRLFATLDPTIRRVTGPRGVTFLAADTVGFISDLPHELVAAFRSTLEESANATLLLHVVDASDPEFREKIDQVNDVLKSIGAHEVPQIEVFNKADCLDGVVPHETLGAAAREAPGAAPGGAMPIDSIGPGVGRIAGPLPRLWVSALTGQGLPELLVAVERALEGRAVALRLKVPFAAGRFRAALFRQARVLAEDASHDGGWELDVEASQTVVERLREEFPLDECLLQPAAICQDGDSI